MRVWQEKGENHRETLDKAKIVTLFTKDKCINLNSTEANNIACDRFSNPDIITAVCMHQVWR